jgi:hypothetical protein
MKFAMVLFLGFLLLASSAPLNAQNIGTSQVVAAYINEPTNSPAPLPGFDGLCLIYYTMLGDLPLTSMFTTGTDNQPIIDRAHAHFIWVSDYKAQYLTDNKEFTFFMILEGTATIYYSDQPESRDWTNRSTWGDPVAKFIRKPGMFQSRDGGVSGTLANTGVLVWGKPVRINGKMFHIKDLIPQGLTCFGAGVGDYEAGSCVAVGK